MRRQRGRLKLIILIVVAMLVAVGLSVGGTLYFMSKGDDLEGSKTQEAATTVSGKQPAIYEVLMPAFVVNFNQGAAALHAGEHRFDVT